MKCGTCGHEWQIMCGSPWLLDGKNGYHREGSRQTGNTLCDRCAEGRPACYTHMVVDCPEEHA